MENVKNLVPENLAGKYLSLQYSKVDESAEIARKTYKSACMRLLNPSIWKDLCGLGSASFRLCGINGQKLLRLAQNGDIIRIDIPGPGPSVDGGYDWVKIEKLIDESNPTGNHENFALQVRPCADPVVKSNETVHFLTDEATSTFILERTNQKVTAFYYGRNEEINLNTGNIIDKVRNTAVALASFAGFAKMQWEKLLKGLIENETLS